MARTRGAKDVKPRKKSVPRGTGGRFQKHRECKPFGPDGPTYEIKDATSPLIDRPPLSPDDFKSAIAAELQATPIAGATPGPAGDVAQGSPPQESGPAPAFDPNALTLEGLTNAWQLPFWALGHLLRILRVIPTADPIVAVGKRRAKDLAKPSYTIYEFYTRQYLGLHPDNQVHVAAGVTGLNATAILPELVEAVMDARRRSALAAAGQGGPTSPAAGA
jgi:hypothetical protein